MRVRGLKGLGALGGQEFREAFGLLFRSSPLCACASAAPHPVVGPVGMNYHYYDYYYYYYIIFTIIHIGIISIIRISSIAISDSYSYHDYQN